jgi:hypothetical protein
MDAMGDLNVAIDRRRRDMRRLVESVDLSMTEIGPRIDVLVRAIVSESHPEVFRFLTLRGQAPTWEGVAAAAAALAGRPEGAAIAPLLDDILLTATVAAVALSW